MMFNQNALIEVLETEDTITIERILWIGGTPPSIATIRVDSPSAIPRVKRLSSLEMAYEGGLLRILDNDPYMFTVDEEDLSTSEITVRDRAWEIIENIVLCEPEIYERSKRGILIDEATKLSGMTKKTIYKFLNRYWIGGMVKNALLPNYSNSGGKGQTRTRGEKKLGRPKKLRDNTGIVISEKIQKIFRAAINKYYIPQTGSTLVRTYEHMLKDHFMNQTIDSSGLMERHLLPKSQLPSLRQFRYWYGQSYSAEEAYVHREGSRKRNLNIRPTLQDSQTKVTGPGSVFQIDSTPMDIYLVSRINRNFGVGRPTLYFVVDVFTCLITGYYVDIVEASWINMSLALRNAFADKVAICKKYGIQIRESQWPSHNAPVAICADRGEGISKNSIKLANQLNIRVDNTPSGRADLKGIVERSFKTFNEDYFKGLPGHIEKDHYERGGTDYRLDARLNIDELNAIVIQAILYHNSNRILLLDFMDEDMLADGVLPIPTELWKWGIQNRSGQLHTLPENVTKYALLPTAAASVTRGGVILRGMRYASEWIIEAKWFESAAINGRERITVCYDPDDMTVIYHKPSGSKEYLPLEMISKSLFKNRTASEIASLKDYWFKQKKELEATALENKITYLCKTDEIVSTAVASAEAEWDHEISKTRRVKDIKKNRALEKQTTPPKEPKPSSKEQQPSSAQDSPAYSDELTWIDDFDLELLEEKQRGNTHGRKK